VTKELLEALPRAAFQAVGFEPSRATSTQSGAVKPSSPVAGAKSVSLAGSCFGSNNGLFQRLALHEREFCESVVVETLAARLLGG
jgi:hypothetical protein